MYFLCPAVIQKFRRFTKLCSADNGIVNQKNTSILNQIMHSKHFHFCNHVTLTLNCRHKGARPRRCIFDKWSGKWDSGFICIADCMSNTGIRNPGNNIRFYMVTFCHIFPAVITHLLNTDSLVGTGWITIVHPQECANPHLASRCHQRFNSLLIYNYNLTRS